MEQFSPPKDRTEWRELIDGKYQFDKYTLQLMIDRIRKEVSAGTKTTDIAIDEIRSFFGKYKNAFKKDLEKIFGDW
ncbi:MAG: hypothetical protein AB8B73_05370 [Ekhidna sp.]